MNSLRQSIEEYLVMRRSLGFKLRQAGTMLLDFATFMERRRASYITPALALAWAQRPAHAQPAHWAGRLCHVRQFARYRSASDPRTQIPAVGLLPFKPKRARPYLYTDAEIQQLLCATLHMPLSPKHRQICALLPWVYYCLFGLLGVTGLRLGEARNLKLEDADLKVGVHRWGEVVMSREPLKCISTRPWLCGRWRARRWSALRLLSSCRQA